MSSSSEVLVCLLYILKIISTLVVYWCILSTLIVLDHVFSRQIMELLQMSGQACSSSIFLSQSEMTTGVAY